MVELAIEGNESFEILTLEIDQEGITYTIDTINKIKRIYPDSDFYFIAGADLMFEITLWKGAPELLKAVKFITTFRPGYSHDRLDMRIQELQDIYGASIYKLYATEMDIASSDIRSRIKNGYSIRYLLPDSVESYIREHDLYLTCSVKEEKNELDGH
jgi:nicotinate-nucleotide adenylyltransferase